MKFWPMRLEPTTLPFRLTKEPLAWWRKAVWPTAHTASGYTTPRRTVRATVTATAVTIWRRSMSVHPQGDEDDVDELDADERGDDAAQAVDQQVAAQDGGRPHGPELDALQSQGDERHDDQGVEDDRREDGGVGVVELHDVEGRQRREHALEHGRDDGEVLGHIVGHRERGERPPGDEELLADLDDLEQ